MEVYARRIFEPSAFKELNYARIGLGPPSKEQLGMLGAVTPLESKVKVASQSVFYTLRTRDGICESGCGASQTRVAEIVFGVEIVEWDLCSACLSLTGFLEYYNSLPSATPREAEEVKILLGISNETFERQNRLPSPVT